MPPPIIIKIRLPSIMGPRDLGASYCAGGATSIFHLWVVADRVAGKGSSMPLPPLTLIIGAAASGKSDFAEGVVTGSGHAPVYLATAQAFDDEMRAKIDRHIDRRGAG